jgi:hypothetical protein
MIELTKQELYLLAMACKITSNTPGIMAEGPALYNALSEKLLIVIGQMGDGTAILTAPPEQKIYETYDGHRYALDSDRKPVWIDDKKPLDT